MNTQDFLNKPVKQVFMRYLVPSVFATMVTSIYVLADTIIVGKGIGTIAVAALNIVLPLYNIFFGLGLLFGVGGSVLMSILRGEGDEKGSNAYFSTSLVAMCVVLALSLAFFTAFMEKIALVFGGTPETMPYIMDYMPYIVWGMGLFFFSSYLQTFIRNDGAPRLAMYAVVSGGVANIILDYIFVYNFNMGMAGAAIATVMGSGLTVVILLTHFFTKKNNLHFSLKGVRPSFIKNIILNGFASFLIEVASGVTIFVFNIQLLKYAGNTGVSVYSVISNTAIVVVCLCKGINQAAQPLLSTNYGAGLYERTDKIRSLAVKVSIIICAVLVIMGLVVPDFFTYIFINPDSAILSMSAPAIRIYFVGFMMLGINMVFICYFQAILKNGYSMIICLMRGLILVVAFAYIFPLFMDVTGIWLAVPAAETITMLFGIYLIYFKKSAQREINDKSL
jgi:putative MATE family efflux protein